MIIYHISIAPIVDNIFSKERKFFLPSIHENPRYIFLLFANFINCIIINIRIKLLFIAIFYIIYKPTIWYIVNNLIYLYIYYIIIMGITTSLHIVSSGKSSLKTTVPVFIVKQFKLKKGDSLDWCIEMHNNETVIIVKKLND